MTDELLGRVEALLERVEASPEALEAVGALVDLYGEGLRRIVARVPEAALADDALVAHLLLLHDLHPVPVEERVRAALAEVRPYLDAHGGDVELLGVEGGVARLRLQGSCSGCPSSEMTLRLAIEEAIHRAAPDVERVEAADAPRAAPVEVAYDACPLPMAAPAAPLPMVAAASPLPTVAAASQRPLAAHAVPPPTAGHASPLPMAGP